MRGDFKVKAARVVRACGHAERVHYIEQATLEHYRRTACPACAKEATCPRADRRGS